MRVNGRTVHWQDGDSVARVAARYFPDADLALIDGSPVEASEWDAIHPGPEAEVVLARRGALPDPDTYQALLLSRNHPGTVAKLSAATVGIAGCGGLGSHAALALARMGVGCLVLADFDIVEPTNLNRQAYFAEDVGRPKVDALADLLGRVNPCVTVSAANLRLDQENSARFFANCDVILECLDQAEAKGMLVEAILSGLKDVPLVAASGLAGLGDANRIATRKIMNRLWLIGDGESGVGPGVGLAAARVLVAAGHQALCAARLIVGDDG